MVAGFQVLEAVKILRGDDTRATGRVTYLTREPNANGLVFISGTLSEPNPKRVLRCVDLIAVLQRYLDFAQVHGVRSEARERRYRYHGNDAADAHGPCHPWTPRLLQPESRQCVSGLDEMANSCPFLAASVGYRQGEPLSRG